MLTCDVQRRAGIRVNSKPLCFICLHLHSLAMHLGKCKLSCVSCADNGPPPPPPLLSTPAAQELPCASPQIELLSLSGAPCFQYDSLFRRFCRFVLIKALVTLICRIFVRKPAVPQSCPAVSSSLPWCSLRLDSVPVTRLTNTNKYKHKYKDCIATDEIPKVCHSQSLLVQKTDFNHES